MEECNIMSGVMTICELCDELHISRKYAYQFIRDNNIRFRQIGRKFYISRLDVKKIIDMEDK